MTPIQKQILIVDDDAFLLDMYALKFTQQGFLVATALGSLQAIERLSEGDYRPDVLLTDVVMPAMDGFDLIKDLREKSLIDKVIVIFLSNLGQQSDIDRGMELGADGYIIKASATPSEVVARVVEVMEKKEA